MLGGTIPERWQLPDRLEVRASNKFAVSRATPRHPTPPTHPTNIDFLPSPRPTICPFFTRTCSRGQGVIIYLFTRTCALSAAAQKLDLSYNMLGGTIPERWQLPDSLEVRASN